MLFNRFPEEDSGGRQKRRVLSKEEQAERSLYKRRNGELYQPADHILGALTKAAVNFRLEGKKTFKDVIRASVFVEPEKILHGTKKYEVDWRPVVINRSRVMKGRGRLDKWSLEFSLTCIDGRVTEETMKDILTYAGAFCGIGDFRPRFGRFIIEKWTKQNEK